MKKPIKNRAISEIIASLLMLVITVSAFAVTIGATAMWISSQRSGSLLALQERLIVEDVWFKTNATGKFICVYSRNVGKVDLEIYAMQVDGVGPSGIAPKPLALTMRFAGWMNASFNWAVSTTYEIKLLTSKGSVFTTHATA